MQGEPFHFSCRNVVERAAIFIVPTQGGGSHTGILYSHNGRRHILDLLWHERLRSRPFDGPEDDYACVVPALELEEFNDVVAVCRLIARRHEERRHIGGYKIPYAFGDSPNTQISPVTGELDLGDGLGLTCSTFVIKVFSAAYLQLVNISEWPMRDKDHERHRALLQQMIDGIPNFAPPAQPEHIDRVSKKVECIRVRPEEVAASGMKDPLPASFSQAERWGRWLLELLTEDYAHAAI